MNRVHPENHVEVHPAASSPSHDSNVAVGVVSNNISQDKHGHIGGRAGEAPEDEGNSAEEYLGL